ncbi:hypothetical protein C4D60_Mb09t06430 [Musa balbisiana]|uniref:BHLH domain-containing protein n=1 Tax=Musa balbisiana TaxID=52838 RepID=A0A4S8IEI8_MUSBA|nr:hypothetical protein C4D60_Mb09t06430 [Musa balbisiana]
MSSSPPFVSGQPRPRPGFAPLANPNAAVATHNPQIGRSPPPSGAPRAASPSPFSASSLPGPPPPFASRPPPQGAAALSQGLISSNGPPVAGLASQRFPPPPPVQQTPPVAAPASVRAPPPSAAPSQAPGVQSFPGSPPAVAPASLPLMGSPASQPFSRPPPTHTPFAGPPASQPPFAGPRTSQPPSAGQPTSQPPFPGPTTFQRPFAGPPSSQPPFGGPPTSQPPFAGPPNSQPPFAGLPYTGPPTSQPFGASPTVQPFTGAPYAGRPSSPSYMGPPSSQPFSGPPTAVTPFGAPAWSSQPRQVAPSMPGAVQAPPTMFGMPPSMPGQSMPPIPPALGHSSLAGPQASTPSKVDPNQIPRPMPSSSVILFETRQGNQANAPPPATSNFIVKDTGNCSPRLMRCTMNQIPCTGDLLSTSSMPLALMVQPLALPHPSEEPIQIVDFGESGPIRCTRCKGFTNDTPRDYYCNLGPDGRRRDADERPELCRGTVEFVATREYMVRDPMPAIFFFLIDVSMNAVQTGATAAACSAISQSLADLPDGPQTMVGIATFDCTIHFYNLRRASQQCRQGLEQLLENIPSMFDNNKVAESAFGAAIKAGFLALKPTGGKLLVFQSVLPSVGIGSLSAREAEGRTNVSAGDKEAHKFLQPADKTLKTMAIEFAEYQASCLVCVDIFITTQTFVDIASISVVPTTTGGQVYYYYPFSALSDPGKLYNDLRWNISRPQGFEAVMRVRCSQGLQVQEYSGNFCKRIPTDIDLPAEAFLMQIDSDKTIMVTFKHDDKFQENSECSFQCALLYTTVYGQRRIRVMNLSLPCTTMLSSLFRSADLDTQFACFLKQAASMIPVSPLSQVHEQITNLCINILHAYRKFCATVSSAGQLILPEALKLLPLYTLALAKSIGLRNDGRLDDRSYWISHVESISISLAIPLVYPRMISIHDLTTKEDDGSLLALYIPLSSEHINDDGIYLLENGEDGLIYIGNMVNPDTLQQIFGVSSVDGLPSQLVLEQFDNELSKKLNDVMNEIRQQRCSYLRLRLCKKGDPSGMHFLSYMVEDKSPGGLSYVEFLTGGVGLYDIEADVWGLHNKRKPSKPSTMIPFTLTGGHLLGSPYGLCGCPRGTETSTTLGMESGDHPFYLTPQPHLMASTSHQSYGHDLEEFVLFDGDLSNADLMSLLREGVLDTSHEGTADHVLRIDTDSDLMSLSRDEVLDTIHEGTNADLISSSREGEFDTSHERTGNHDLQVDDDARVREGRCDEQRGGDGDSPEVIPKTRKDRSKTLISERTRRVRMKEQLYELRSLVPNITKVSSSSAICARSCVEMQSTMDKASIIADAIAHVKDLQSQANKLEEEINLLESGSNGEQMLQASSRGAAVGMQPQETATTAAGSRITQVNAYQVGEGRFYVKVEGSMGDGGEPSALYSALASLSCFDMESSHFSLISEGFVFNLTFKVGRNLFPVLQVGNFSGEMNASSMEIWVMGALVKKGFQLMQTTTL